MKNWNPYIEMGRIVSIASALLLMPGAVFGAPRAQGVRSAQSPHGPTPASSAARGEAGTASSPQGQAVPRPHDSRAGHPVAAARAARPRATARPRPTASRGNRPGVAGSTSGQSTKRILRLTLRSALTMARKHNLELQAVRYQQKAARIGVKAAYGSLGPHVSLSADLRFQGGGSAFEGGGGSSSSPFGCEDMSDPNCVATMMQTMCGTTDTNDSCVQFLMTSDGQNTAKMLGNTLSSTMGGFSSIGKIFQANSFNPAVTLVWPLFNAQALVGIKRARVGVKMAGLQVLDKGQDVSLRVYATFYQTLQLQELTGLAQQSMRSTMGHLKQTRALVEAGSATKTDILRWEAQLEQNRLDFLKAHLGVTQLKMLLNNLLGRPIKAALVLVAPAEVTGRLPKSTGLSDRSVSHHPLMRLARLSILQKRLDLRSVQARFLPTLSLTAQYSWSKYIQYLDVVPRKWIGSWMVGISLKVPLFDSMSDYYQTRSKQYELLQIKVQTRNLGRMLRHQFHAALLDVRSAKQQVTTSKKQVELAAAAHHSAELLYNAGNAKTTDLLDAQIREIQARANLIRSRYDYLIALARLRRAAGKI